jgi:TolB-like protein
MRKFYSLFILFLFFAGWLPAQQLSLDTVIERSAQSVEEALRQGTKAAVLNFASTSEAFSDYVIEELTGKLVLGKKVTIVDRRNMALITQELNLQLSGDVSDESAQAIGKMLGAQSIVSGSLTNMGNFYRFRVKVISVETAAIQTQISLDMKNDAQVAFLFGGSLQNSASTTSGGTAQTNNGITSASSSGNTPNISTYDVATPLTEGITVPGNSLAEKLGWLTRTADSHNTYIIAANANETIAPYTFEFRGAINITVALRGDNQNRIIRLRSNGTMFTVKENVTFILENNITLQGHNGNNGPMVYVERSGILKMKTGSTITGNNNNREGGGVYNNGTFEMTGGTISSNTASRGGGVFHYGGAFTMTGGTISGNSTTGRGGGVWHDSPFTMRGGIITGNTAREYGGGVYVSGTFTKTGGTITGYNSDQSNGNVIRDESGNMLARRGHAVYRHENQRKETTAGPSVNLSSNDSGRWD